MPISDECIAKTYTAAEVVAIVRRLRSRLEDRDWRKDTDAFPDPDELSLVRKLLEDIRTGGCDCGQCLRWDDIGDKCKAAVIGECTQYVPVSGE